MFFGRNTQADLLLAVIGLRECDVERFRDISASDDGTAISVYTRTGGGNRESYPNVAMRKLRWWLSSVDDDFDSTYCTDTFVVPDRWRNDVIALRDPLSFGIRKSFARHLAKTLRRAPTEADLMFSAIREEEAALARTDHIMANGHTFVPKSDHAMKVALELAEKNGGKLRSCWGILPLAVTVTLHRNSERYKGAFCRWWVEEKYWGPGAGWVIDHDYWDHCVAAFGAEFPMSVARISEEIERVEAKK